MHLYHCLLLTRIDIRYSLKYYLTFRCGCTCFEDNSCKQQQANNLIEDPDKQKQNTSGSDETCDVLLQDARDELIQTLDDQYRSLIDKYESLLGVYNQTCAGATSYQEDEGQERAMSIHDELGLMEISVDLNYEENSLKISDIHNDSVTSQSESESSGFSENSEMATSEDLSEVIGQQTRDCQTDIVFEQRSF